MDPKVQLHAIPTPYSPSPVVNHTETVFPVVYFKVENLADLPKWAAWTGKTLGTRMCLGGVPPVIVAIFNANAHDTTTQVRALLNAGVNRCFHQITPEQLAEIFMESLTSTKHSSAATTKPIVPLSTPDLESMPSNDDYQGILDALQADNGLERMD
jgi:hypothetical protein